MSRLPATLTLLTIFAASCAKRPTTEACATFSEADAVKLLGGPLGEVARYDYPDDENGNGHRYGCGYFPKGFDIRTARRPPERGIEIDTHAFPTADAAKKYFDGNLELQEKIGAEPGRPAVTPVADLGEGAYLLGVVIPDSPSRITTLTFRKSAVTVWIQVWNKSGSVEDMARAAARKVLARLP